MNTPAARIAIVSSVWRPGDADHRASVRLRHGDPAHDAHESQLRGSPCVRIRRLAARYRGLKTSVDSYIHTRYDAPGASMKIVAGSGSVAMAREIPRIFES